MFMVDRIELKPKAVTVAESIRAVLAGHLSGEEIACPQSMARGVLPCNEVVSLGDRFPEFSFPALDLLG